MVFSGGKRRSRHSIPRVQDYLEKRSDRNKVFNACGRWLKEEWYGMSYLDRLRHRVTGTTRKDAPEYECSGCGAGFERRRQVCPECDGYSIRRREWTPLEPIER